MNTDRLANERVNRINPPNQGERTPEQIAASDALRKERAKITALVFALLFSGAALWKGSEATGRVVEKGDHALREADRLDSYIEADNRLLDQIDPNGRVIPVLNGEQHSASPSSTDTRRQVQRVVTAGVFADGAGQEGLSDK